MNKTKAIALGWVSGWFAFEMAIMVFMPKSTVYHLTKLIIGLIVGIWILLLREEL